MIELDEFWSEMLSDASRAAREAGRHHVADYLELKARNDAIRNAGVRWLFDALMEFAGEANRRQIAVTADSEQPYNFSDHGHNMAGSRLILRHGIRCLSLEAGWTRTPSDGFMKGGSLAVAKIAHFGLAKFNSRLLLRMQEGKLVWHAVDDDGKETAADLHFLGSHFEKFISG